MIFPLTLATACERTQAFHSKPILPLAYDNLKVWNFAKTDFSDRFAEGYLGSSVLTVVDARGNASPVSGATQYICTGASIIGNDVTASGATNVLLTLTNATTLTWNWRTLYQLTTATNGSGSVTGGGWYTAGSNAVLGATPSAGNQFAGWDDGETNASRSVVMPASGASYAAIFTPIPRGTIRLQSATYNVLENAPSVALVVERVGGSYGAAYVDVATSNATAVAGLDFEELIDTLYWSNGNHANKTITVYLGGMMRCNINNDGTWDASQAFFRLRAMQK